jgi:hypothetical protein
MILAALLIALAAFGGWYAAVHLRAERRHKALLKATLDYQASHAVKGVLLERRGPNVLPLLFPTSRVCPGCGAGHLAHPAIVDDRCPDCLSKSFDDGAINPGGGWGAA